SYRAIAVTPAGETLFAFDGATLVAYDLRTRDASRSSSSPSSALPVRNSSTSVCASKLPTSQIALACNERGEVYVPCNGSDIRVYGALVLHVSCRGVMRWSRVGVYVPSASMAPVLLAKKLSCPQNTNPRGLV